MVNENPSPIGPPASAKSINSLVLNVVLPGLGTIIGGKSGLGVIQLVMFVLGIPLIFLSGLGFLLMAAAWVWAVITGIQMLSASTSSGPPIQPGPGM